MPAGGGVIVIDEEGPPRRAAVAMESESEEVSALNAAILRAEGISAYYRPLPSWTQSTSDAVAVLGEMVKSWNTTATQINNACDALNGWPA